MNGKEKLLEKTPTLKELLDSMQVKPEMVACELNLNIIKRKDYSSTKLSEGDQLEILQMIGGG